MMTNFDLSFETHADLALCMADIAENKNVVYAVVFYEDAKRLIKELGCIEGTTFGCVELYDPLWNGYTKEYYVSVDENLKIDVEPAWHEKNEWHDAGYLRADSSIAFIHSDASSKIIEALKDCTCAEFFIDADADCDDCDGCRLCCIEDDDEGCEELNSAIIDFFESVLEAFLEN